MITPENFMDNAENMVVKEITPDIQILALPAEIETWWVAIKVGPGVFATDRPVTPEEAPRMLAVLMNIGCAQIGEQDPDFLVKQAEWAVEHAEHRSPMDCFVEFAAGLRDKTENLDALDLQVPIPQSTGEFRCSVVLPN